MYATYDLKISVKTKIVDVIIAQNTYMYKKNDQKLALTKICGMLHALLSHTSILQTLAIQ